MQYLKSLILFLCASTLFGLQTRNNLATEQNRFDSGFPSNPVPNASSNFLLDGYDLSGIGWDTNTTQKGFVMISPIHFIAATHYAPNASNSITFNNRDNQLVTIGVGSTEVMTNSDNSSNSDLTLGTLDREITASDKINFFAVADLLTEASYTGREILVYGRTPKVGRGTIGSFQDFGADPITAGSGLNESRTYQFSYSDLAGGGNDAYFEVGDSGSPSFTIIGGQLAITGTHSALVDTGTTKTNYDTFVPDYADELNTAMASEGYQLTAVPEPAAYGLLIAAFSAILVFWRRR
jgi:hypothetical protein